MRCPICDYPHSRQIKTKPKTAEDGEHHVQRRRECLDCKKRFNTYECYDLPDTESDVKLEATREHMAKAFKILQ